jgi:hypothetical protein
VGEGPRLKRRCMWAVVPGARVASGRRGIGGNNPPRDAQRCP